MSVPRALAFDVFGTVVDWRSSIIRELEEFGQRHGLQQDWPSFADDWRAGYAPAMDRVRRGELPWTRIDDLHRMILEELLARGRHHVDLRRGRRRPQPRLASARPVAGQRAPA